MTFLPWRLRLRRCSPRLFVAGLLAGPLWLLLTTTVLADGVAFDRYKRDEPGLILETGGRRGNCDVLTFTPDGKYLLAAGDDKVVHTWRFEPNKLPKDGARLIAQDPVRWPIWREQRGSIFALAMSPQDSSKIVVGGFGSLKTCFPVCLLDRQTGQIEHTLFGDELDPQVIWSLAYSPAGKSIAIGRDDGSVVIWDPDGDKWVDGDLVNKFLQLNAAATKPGVVNRVKLLVFRSENTLAALVEDGRLLEYDIRKPKDDPSITDLKMRVLRAAVSPTKDKIAVCEAGVNRKVKVVSLAGASGAQTIDLPGFLPESVTFDAKGQRLAVGYSASDRKLPSEWGLPGRLVVYDISGNEPRVVAGPFPCSLPQAMAFHPDGAHLAVAGEEDHEIVLLDVTGARPVQVDRKVGVGGFVWGLGVAKDYIAFQEDMDPKPEHPNHRGMEDQKATRARRWSRVFNLSRQGWATPEEWDGVQFATAIDRLPGWEVRFGDPADNGTKVTYSSRWFVVGPDKKAYKIPWDRARDDRPLCYTFLPEVKGKPVRLAVGHYWGFSLFELAQGKEPRRVKYFIGHDGEVVAIAASVDGQTLVTASRDQTVAAWSLADWKGDDPGLGATFVVKAGRLMVDAVDVGSPSWDAGLKEGDEVRMLQISGDDFVFDPDAKVNAIDRKQAQRLGHVTLDINECWKRLRSAEPGKEHLIGVLRNREFVKAVTTIKQRPIWRFFATNPQKGDEWVLWNWRDYYYDASANGGRYIGWQINKGLDGCTDKPAFYRAEQFEKQFFNRDKVRVLLDTMRVAPARVSIPKLEPPKITLAVENILKAADAHLTISLEPQRDLPSQELEEIRIWVNDHVAQTIPNVKTARADPKKGKADPLKVVINKDQLRLGENVITVHGYNKEGARAEVYQRVYFEDNRRKPNLFVVAVGVNNYEDKIKNVSKGNLNLRYAVEDARAFEELWKSQEGKLFAKVNVVSPPLLDENATREKILNHLASLKELQDNKGLTADDFVMVFFAGHGLAVKDEMGLLQPGSYVYVCPGFDNNRPTETGVGSKALYAALAQLNCRKVVFLDTCHSGAMDPLRDLRPNGMGPLILSSCAPHETAGEDAELGHGFFTNAILEALGDELPADENKDGVVNVEELVRYLERYVPSQAAQHKKRGPQNPQHSPPDPGVERLFVKDKGS